MTRTLLLLACVATASRAEVVISLGGFANTTAASFLSSPLTAGPSLGVAWSHPLGFGLGGGLRAAPPSATAPVPLEVYVRGFFTTTLGPWEPLLGPELGISGLSGLAKPPPRRATDFANAESAVGGPLYVAFHTELLRFAFGARFSGPRRFFVSVAGLDVGTSVVAAGAVLRLHVDLLTVGVRW